jgi:hypothetical protein
MSAVQFANTLQQVITTQNCNATSAGYLQQLSMQMFSLLSKKEQAYMLQLMQQQLAEAKYKQNCQVD